MKQHLEAYAVREANYQTYWTRIGVAFPTKNGGFTLLIDAMPASTDGQYKIVVQQPKAADRQISDDEFNDPTFPFEPERATPVQRAPRSGGRS